jgi:A/G-specific adenine glycosylase
LILEPETLDLDPHPLLDWYRADHRDLPWRNDPAPYRVWISEIMLQQTRVETVVPYFERFLTSFPDVPTLAAADLAEVLKLWEGLGYYTRAKKLHECAKVLVCDYDGVLPSTAAELKKLPGFGPYTSAAVASIAFDEAVAVVDGNVLRVGARYFGIADDIAQQSTKDQIRGYMQVAIESTDDPSAFNQGVMELGARVCTPRNPGCLMCPLNNDCVAMGQGLTEDLPVKKSRKPIPTYAVAVAVIRDGINVLLQRRDTNGMLPGLWEFPGGKVDADLRDGLRRKVEAQNGVQIRVGEQLTEVSQTYSHFRINVTAFDCEFTGGEPMAGSGLSELRWVSSSATEELALGLTARKVAETIGLRKSE